MRGQGREETLDLSRFGGGIGKSPWVSQARWGKIGERPWVSMLGGGIGKRPWVFRLGGAGGGGDR